MARAVKRCGEFPTSSGQPKFADVKSNSLCRDVHRAGRHAEHFLRCSGPPASRRASRTRPRLRPSPRRGGGVRARRLHAARRLDLFTFRRRAPRTERQPVRPLRLARRKDPGRARVRRDVRRFEPVAPRDVSRRASRASLCVHHDASVRGEARHDAGFVPSWLLARRKARGQVARVRQPQGVHRSHASEHEHPGLGALQASRLPHARSGRRLAEVPGAQRQAGRQARAGVAGAAARRRPGEAHVDHERLPDAVVQRERRVHRRPGRTEPAHVRRRVGRVRRQRRPGPDVGSEPRRQDRLARLEGDRQRGRACG